MAKLKQFIIMMLNLVPVLLNPANYSSTRNTEVTYPKLEIQEEYPKWRKYYR